MSKDNRLVRLFKRRPFTLIAVVIVLIGIGLAKAMLFKADEGSSSNLAIFTVRQGPLRISVTETGSIQAREKIIMKNEVEGKTSIISLVDEGAGVKKGDLLIELDASDLLDNKIDQEIKVQNTEAAFVGARENLAVIQNRARSDVDKAELTYDFAVEDLEKYLEGEYPNKLKELESRITLAKEEVIRAREELEWSEKLFSEKYISQSELEADELALKKKAVDLELAENNLSLFKDFTHKRKLAQLESDVKQAKMALERTTRKAKADVVQARASLKAKESEFKRQQAKLEKTEKQIEKAKIYAPADGVVIHATSAQRGGGHHRRPVEPLAEGAQVRERQELIHLPTTSGVNAEIGVYEASLDKVSVGLPAVITIDALPGERFTGRVVSIAPLPNAQSMFMNPDLKIYDTTIYLDDTDNIGLLRSGMSCTAEIIIEQHKQATYIPVQAVLRVAGEPTVYVVEGKTLESRKVRIGYDNDRMVQIISGLQPGEVVSIAPPLAAAAAQAPTFEESAEMTSVSIAIPETAQKDISGRVAKRPGTGGVQGPGSGSAPGSGPGSGGGPPTGSGSGPSPGGRPQGGDFIQRFDSDNDRKVSKDEFPGPDETFNRLDQNGDGYVSKNEAPKGPPGGGPRSGDGTASGLPGGGPGSGQRGAGK